MSWIFCNPNPMYNLVEDCTVRAISIATNQDWHTTYLGIAMKGNDMCNMPSANSVWGAYLLSNGFKRHIEIFVTITRMAFIFWPLVRMS